MQYLAALGAELDLLLVGDDADMTSLLETGIEKVRGVESNNVTSIQLAAL